GPLVPFSFQPAIGNSRYDADARALLTYFFQLDEGAHFRDHHFVDPFHTTGERGTVATFRLPGRVIPDLAIRAFAVPAKVAVRNRVEGKVLEAAQQPIIFWYLDALTQDFNRDEFFERVEEI